MESNSKRSAHTTLEMNNEDGKTIKALYRCLILELEQDEDYWKVMYLPNVWPRNKELSSSHKKMNKTPTPFRKSCPTAHIPDASRQKWYQQPVNLDHSAEFIYSPFSLFIFLWDSFVCVVSAGSFSIYSVKRHLSIFLGWLHTHIYELILFYGQKTGEHFSRTIWPQKKL